MALDDVQIDVISQQTPLVHNSVNYQPFAVKILKLRVRRNQATKPNLDPIWIRPVSYQRPVHQAAEASQWRAYGTAGDDEDLWVAWGAGDERGFAVKTNDLLGFNKKAVPLDDDAYYYIYLHLIHRPAEPLTHVPVSKSLTIQAIDANDIVHGEKTVQLTVPVGAADALRAVWHTDWSKESSTIQLAGPAGQTPTVPRYISRWWPKGQVDYEPVGAKLADFLSELKIIFQRRDHNAASGRITVKHGQDDLMRIGGDIAIPLHDYRLCNVELFRFLDERHVVLRIWLFWVQLRFTANQLLTYVPEAEKVARRAAAEELAADLDAWWKGGAMGKIRFLPWRIKEEVPDVERVDLLIDPEDSSLKFIGTDTHWQEFWAVSKDLNKPIEVTIAPLSDSKEVFLQSLKVPKKNTPPIFNPLANGLCDFVNDNHLDCPHRLGEGQMVPVPKLDSEVNYRVCTQCGTHFTGEGVKAVGVAKHAPVLGNVDVLAGNKNGLGDAVSSNVLDG